MTRHPLSVLGVSLATMSGVLFALSLLLELAGFHPNPYLGILFFLLLPAVFVLGLLLIPLGTVMERRRAATGRPPHRWPRIDFNDPSRRRAIAIVAALTAANVLIVSLAAYRAVEYVDSPSFCGQICHTVMQPEFVANQNGPHARVACVECHVGEGARSFIRYKLNGARQLVSLVRGSYPTPIPSPVHDLRPASDTCETCHWPERFHGDKAVTIPEFANDEQSTESLTRLLLRLGGGSDRQGISTGIHWHANPANEIEFVATDATRRAIPYVRLKDGNGTISEYRTPEATDAEIAAGERRRMDCVDCHNRPTHALSVSAERAVDGAIARGEIPRTLPFARRQTVEVLKVEYPDRSVAEQSIAQRLRAFYAESAAAARREELDRMVRAAQRLYAENVFPAMKVTWGTHADHLGHTDAPGCFRCHDDNHNTPDGRTIRQDCALCHDIQ
jgi:hypothetical protein